MTVLKTALPRESILTASLEKYDYADSFQGILNDPENKYTVADIGQSFFSSGPKWIGKLFAFRNRIVSLLGLKTPGKTGQETRNDFKFEKGNRFGLFKVIDKTANEIVLGEDDTHLDFRVSLLLGKQTELSRKKVTITTIVQFNNWFGRLYFLPVKPFHKLIVPAMLKGIISALEKENSA